MSCTPFYCCLNRLQFFRLCRSRLVDLLDILVGQLLHILFCICQLVLGDLRLLLCCLPLINGIAANVADGNLGCFAFLGYLLDELLTALLGQRREAQTNQLAIVLRVDAQLGSLDCLDNLLEQRCIPRLDRKSTRLNSSH